VFVWFKRASASLVLSSGTLGSLMAAFGLPALQYIKQVSKTIRPSSHNSAVMQAEANGALHIFRVLALVPSGLDVAAVELVVQHMAGVLLGFFGGVEVVRIVRREVMSQRLQESPYNRWI
jgi:hypothetical protein